MDKNKSESVKKFSDFGNNCVYYLSFFTHDLLVFLSYFLNNFLFNFYHHVVFKTIFSGFKCINHFYTSNLSFTTKFLELSVSFLVVYTWINKYSFQFDGYAFHHIFYYRYGEMLSRVFGTLAGASAFGFLYHKAFNVNSNSYVSNLKRTLYKMMDSNRSYTILEFLVFSHYNKSERLLFTKKLLSKLLLLRSMKYEDKYYELVEKYIALLFEFFFVEVSFSLLVYTLSYVALSSKHSPKANMALNTVVRGVFVTCGNMFLDKLGGKITLDECKSLFMFFEERDVALLVVRLMANVVGAFLIPFLLPLPKVLCLSEYQELFPSSKFELKFYASEFCNNYYVKTNELDRRKVCYRKWPASKLGKVFYSLEKMLFGNFLTEVIKTPY